MFKDLAPYPGAAELAEEHAQASVLAGYEAEEIIDADYLDRKRIELLSEEVRLKERELEILKGLPHLYSWPLYLWMRQFFDSTSKQIFLVAANQLGKSSIQIRKVIHWATEKTLWPGLWAHEPKQFWYLYPSQEVVDAEFQLKWVTEYLPQGKFKTDPKYGWQAINSRSTRSVSGIRFNSGVHLFFKTYTKRVSHLQTGTVDYVACDEELPIEYYPELVARLNRTAGFFSMVFTATLGQDYWRKVLEPAELEQEELPYAEKIHASLYDSQTYEDGTPSVWTKEKIDHILRQCQSHSEILRRVYGRFVVNEDRTFNTYDSRRHLVQKEKLEGRWLLYAGIDPGTGGKRGHPAAILILAVSEDYRNGRVIGCWRGDGIETTSSDIVTHLKELKHRLGVTVTMQFYDTASKDFHIVGTRMGETLFPAEKGQTLCANMLNTLFQHDMLKLFDDGDVYKLSTELSTCRGLYVHGKTKTRKNDDLIDALRYAVSSVPWDFSQLVGELTDAEIGERREQKEIESYAPDARRSRHMREEEPELQSVDAEMAEANEYYG